jgi:hypothetical protein
MKKPNEFSSINELEDCLYDYDKKFKNRALAMWASLPVIAIFLIATIVGFSYGLSWLTWLGVGCTAFGTLSLTSSMISAFKYSNLQEDVQSEIHKRELVETMKKLAKQNQKNNVSSFDMKKIATQKKQTDKTNNQDNTFNY